MTRSRRIVAVTAALFILLAGCGSDSRRSVSRPQRHAMSAELHGQYRIGDARRLPEPDPADRRALAAIATGPGPTASEIAAAMTEMDAITASPDLHPSDAVSVARLEHEETAARAAAHRFATTPAAARSGYRLASGYLAGIGAHWIDWSRVTRAFDPASPAMLLFDQASPAHLVGLSYYVRSATEPIGFRGAGAHWHRHAGLCIVHGVLVGEGVARRADCDHGRGTLVPGRDLWMLHAWVVPGHANPLGTFAALNSSLCTRASPCTPDGSVPTGLPIAPGGSTSGVAP